MKNIFYILSLFLGLACCFSSCEMKKELGGDDQDPETAKGILDLSLVYVPETKADNMKAEDFNVSVYNEQNDLALYFDTYEALKATPQVLLPVGTYKVICSWGEKKEAAFDSPYFEGSKKSQIVANEVTKTEVSAAIQNVKVNVSLSDDFLKNYKDNYSITLTNGKGVLVFNKNELRTAYFMPGTTLKYTIKATTKAGKEAILSGLLKNESGTASGGDTFNIAIDVVPEVPEVPTDPEEPVVPPSQVSVGIKVEITLITREIEIVVPTEPTTPENPGDPGDPGVPATAITITGASFDIDEPQTMTVEASKTVVLDVVLGATAGMAKVDVKIISPAIEKLLEDVGAENPFDLISLSPVMTDLLDEIELECPSKGDKTFTFKIGPFMQLLGEGLHKFDVTITDAADKSLKKTLTINITA